VSNAGPNAYTAVGTEIIAMLVEQRLIENEHISE
jgi:hypothetical protein